MRISFAFEQLYRPIDDTQFQLLNNLREQLSNAAHTLYGLLQELKYQDYDSRKFGIISHNTQLAGKLREKVMELGRESIDNGWWVKNGTNGEALSRFDGEIAASLLHEDLFVSDYDDTA